jgi:Reverse transcriptase (RNA-dependent DNA polymerase)
VKKYSCLLAPFVAVLINVWLLSGQFPDCFKQAIVVPLLKKHNLYSSVMKKYQPVSNLLFVSKLLEKVVQLQLQSHLLSNGLVPPTQTAYRAHYITKTVLLNIFIDRLMASGRGEATVRSMLNLSAANDTVDHDALHARLQRMFGFNGSALNWLQSYLMNCR